MTDSRFSYLNRRSKLPRSVTDAMMAGAKLAPFTYVEEALSGNPHFDVFRHSGGMDLDEDGYVDFYAGQTPAGRRYIVITTDNDAHVYVEGHVSPRPEDLNERERRVTPHYSLADERPVAASGSFLSYSAGTRVRDRRQPGIEMELIGRISGTQTWQMEGMVGQRVVTEHELATRWEEIPTPHA